MARKTTSKVLMIECARCHESKDANDNQFGKSLRSKNGFRSYCRQCDSNASKASKRKAVERRKQEIQEAQANAPLNLNTSMDIQEVNELFNIS